MHLISIVMPLYNSEETVIESVNSVINQSYTNWELIICDDGSTDKSIKLIHDNFSDNRIKIVNNKFIKGAAGARNTGIRKSSGRFLCFLDSDDLWHADKLSIQVNFMLDNNVTFSHGDYFTFDVNNSERGEFISPEIITFEDIIYKCDIGCLTVMIDTEIFPNISFPYIVKEDYALWIILFKRYNIKSFKYPKILASYRISNNSLSSNKVKEVPKQYIVLKVYGGLSAIKRGFCLLTYCAYGFNKFFFKYR